MDIRERVLNAFQQEHREHLEGIRAILVNWPAIAPEAMEEAFRMAHSIKGGARVCDLGTVEKLAHYVEHLFVGFTRGGEEPTPELHGSIDLVLDAIEDYMAALAENRVPKEPDDLLALIEPSLLPPPGAETEEPSGPAGNPEPAAPEKAPAVARTPPKSDILRVSAIHLDRLLQSSGLLLAEAVRQGDIERELRELGASIHLLQKSCEAELVSRDFLPSQSGDAKGTAAATLDDLRRGLAGATRQIRRIRTLQQQGARSLRGMGEQLQGDVRRARMVPAISAFEAFPKMVRDLAREEGKQVEFAALGLEREADRLVLQALKDPVMHVLRNAVHHGIETPEERRAAGKPGQGHIRMELEVFGSRLVLRVTDDGRGLDLKKIRRQAVERRFFSEDEAAGLTADETLDLLFRPGFSTASAVTNVSGRGVGLSVVKEAAIRLQGSAQIAPAPEGGSCLTLSTPLSIATHRMLLVRSGERSFAIPAGAIASLHRVPVSEVRTAEGRSILLFRNEPVLLATLDATLGQDSGALMTEGGFIQVVLLRVGDRPLALSVDAMLRELNVLISPLPYPASASPFFSGGVILEDGSIALVLNVTILLERFKGRHLEERVEAAPVPLAPDKPTVLVVDDSFTARTLQKGILETEGYEVHIAVDGEQALSALRAHLFDAVVTDVQMPRMDGFQLLEEMKRDNRLKKIPVILVTSLSSEEDQAKGLALGADAYIVKQKFDHRLLLDAVRQIV